MANIENTALPIIQQGNCLELLANFKNISDAAFLDPPFNQGRDYRFFDDRQTPEQYWKWISEVLVRIYDVTSDGGAVYFMQREKNTEFVLTALRQTGWVFQNLIIWKKMTSAVPSNIRYGKAHQIIAFATKGTKPRVFNKLRIDPPPPPHWKHERPKGVYLTDVWDDIRELTSGYFAGGEPLRDSKGDRAHKQQSPMALLARIILSSSMPGDTILDPFAGTGTTLAAAQQLRRRSVGIEIDPANISYAEQRLAAVRPADDLSACRSYYRHTANLEKIWGASVLR